MKLKLSAMIILSLLTAVSAVFVFNREDVPAAGPMAKIELSLWHNFTGEDLRAQTMRSIIKEFQDANPDIALHIEAIPPDGYRTRLKTVAAADEMPDVFVMWSGAMTEEFSSASLVQPINGLVEANPEWRDGFLSGSLEAFTEDGNIYGAPMGLSPTSILYYNKGIFNKYGLKVPETWDGLLAVIERLKREGVTPIALGNKAAWLAQSSIFSSLADRVTGTDWLLKAVKQEGAGFTDPPFVEALTYMAQLGEVGAFQEGYNNIDNTQMELMFAKGEAAMMIDGGWALSNLAANATIEQMREMGAAVLPSIPGGKGDPRTLSGAVGSGMALGKDATGKKREAALRLIYAMSGPEAQRRTLESNQLVSYKIELDKGKATPIFSEVYNLVNSVKLTPIYDSMLTSEGTEALNNGLQELLAGGDPKEVAKSVQAAHAKALAEQH
ncbi:extracellular solute-binding protein [Paenibacillus sp. GCM10027627]|uniref:extracellular solute-binding protein n=1 Tax=unclassified Paenibacillus TaxID=185978 RepID=UPI00363A0D4D